MENRTGTSPFTKMLLLIIVLLLCLVPLLTQTSSTLAYGAPLGDSNSSLKGQLYFPLDFTEHDPTTMALEGVTSSGTAPVEQVSFNLATTNNSLTLKNISLEVSRLESFPWSGYYWEANWINRVTGEETRSEPQFFSPTTTAPHQSYSLPLQPPSPADSLVEVRITPADATGALWGQLEAGNRWTLNFGLEEGSPTPFSSPTLAVEGNLYYENTAGELVSTYYIKDLRVPPAPTLSTHTLTFDPNGGVGRHAPLVGGLGDILTPPPASTFTRTGFFFAGWSTDRDGHKPFDFSTPLKASPTNIVLYAQWSTVDLQLVAIKFAPNGGSYVATQYLNAGDLVVKPLDPVRNGHFFKHWTSDLDGLKPWDFTVDRVAVGLKELVLCPQWELDPLAKFYVQFEANDGSPTPPTLLLPPGSLLPRVHTPTKNYNEFTGWYKEHTLTNTWFLGSDTTPAQDIYLYAGWTFKDKGSSTSDPDPNIKHWEEGVWGAAKDLMTQHTADRESWILYEGNLATPTESKTAQDHILLMMKESFKMPRSVLDLLSSQGDRKLQVNVGNGYQWHFSGDSPWRELEYKDYNLQVADSSHPAIKRLVGSNLSHQFRIHHLGSWPLRPYLSLQLGSNFTNKKLYLYSYNPHTNRLEYVAPLATLQDGRFLMPLPPTGGSAVGEYVVTTALFKDAIVLPTNPDTGGRPLDYLLSYGRLLPDKNSIITLQALPLTITSRQIGLFILILLTLINTVALIRLQLKRRKL